MKLLAIETSGNICGTCILENGNIIDKLELDNGFTHSQNLMPLIQKLLEKNNLKISDFDAFACDIGPGSFTGIRIGVATVKALIDSLNGRALYTGVSSLETLAYNVNTDGLICSIIDCKNDNCYFALYKLENGICNEIIPPSANTIVEMTNTLNQFTNDSITFTGDINIVEDFNNAKLAETNCINTANLALAGYKKISTQSTLDLSPLYLKKPQAERQLEEKLKKD